MLYFLEAWLSAALLIFTIGILGLGLVAPFAEDLRFPFLTAPLAGLTLLPLIANTVYAVAGVNYRLSLVVALAAPAAIVALQWRSLCWTRGLLQLTPAAIAVSLIMLLLMDARSILVGGPAIFFKYGTDQSGYAEMGDWLLSFTSQTRPIDDGGVWPYQSFPEILFNTDPRFGTFGILAMIALAIKSDSLFAYPFATAIVIGAGVMSCSALFSHRWASLAVCFVCLLASQWIDYGYVGFLGRIIAYPSILFLMGFALLAVTGGRARLWALVVMAGGVGSAYPGFIVGILVASMLLPCIILRHLIANRTAPPAGATTTAGVVAILVPFLSSGTASRPVPVGQIVQGLDWRTVLPRVLDIDDRSLPMTGLQPDTVLMLTALSLVAAAVLAGVALLHRQPDVLGAVVGPLAFMGALFAAGKTSSVQEFAGVPYPALVVGSVLLMESVRGRALLAAGLALAVQAAIRLPRLHMTVSLFGYAPDPDYVISLAEVQQLRHDIGGQTVEIETGPDVNRALWLMSEFGQMAGQVRWAPDTWRAVLSYRPNWTYKAPPTPSRLRLSEDLTGNVFHHFKIEPAAP